MIVALFATAHQLVYTKTLPPLTPLATLKMVPTTVCKWLMGPFTGNPAVSAVTKTP
jgi:hypothetical protein